MRITVKGRNIEITDPIRAYAEEKIGKVMNHYDQIQSIDVVLNVIKNPSVAQSHTAEVLCKFVSGSVQAEESGSSPGYRHHSGPRQSLCGWKRIHC